MTKTPKKDIKVYNKNCLEADKIIPDGSVDLFFVDPPYFITSIAWDKQWKNTEEYLAWCKTWIEQMYRKLKDNGSAYICCQWQHSGEYHKLLEEVGFKILNRITWKRDKGRGSARNWKQMHEDIWFVTKGKDYTFNIEDVMVLKEVIAPYRDEQGNPKDWWHDPATGKPVRMTYPGNLWEHYTIPFWSSHEVRSYAKSKRSPQNTLEKHNTQKPKDMVKACIKASSNPGDLVVDFFSGSGTTLIAARELGRKAIGFEKDPIYCEMIKTRLANE